MSMPQGSAADRLDTPADFPPWRALPASQQPEWPDPGPVREVSDRLAAVPPLVPAEEVDRLTVRLGEVVQGRAFLLQGGDCAEVFGGAVAERARGKARTLRRMAAVLEPALGLPVVQVGRIAGQYAKPRSNSTESRGGVELDAYRGDAVNGAAFTAGARSPDPRRLLRMYAESAVTLAALRSVHRDEGDRRAADAAAIRAFVDADPAREEYRPLLEDAEPGAPGSGGPLYTSHEALLLDYEGALVRTDPRTGRAYGSSGHLLWIGERTRDAAQAHVEFARGIANPVAVKLGPSATADDALELCRRLNPANTPGRLLFITRMGADQAARCLPELIGKVTAEGARVGWVCDPMHGNTVRGPDGRKTRRLADVVAEIEAFFDVHRSLGTHAGGLHLELTADEVTECLGGTREVAGSDLGLRYETACDPRLNRSQALDTAFSAAGIARKSNGRETGSRKPAPGFRSSEFFDGLGEGHGTKVSNMLNYGLHRAVHEFIKAASEPAGPESGPRVPGKESDLLAHRDLRGLADSGVHPVLINAFARATGKSRDEYRDQLSGTLRLDGRRPRWRK